LAFKYVRSS